MTKKSLKQVFSGVVVNDKLDQTITVLVDRKFMHKIYRKTIVKSKKYLVHDPKNEAKISDEVKIIYWRPISKRKRFSLLKIKGKDVSQNIVEKEENDSAGK